MTSAFGVEHVYKGLKPAHLRALDKVGRTMADTRHGDYANAKLGLRLTGKNPRRAKSMMAMTTTPLKKEPLP